MMDTTQKKIASVCWIALLAICTGASGQIGATDSGPDGFPETPPAPRQPAPRPPTKPTTPESKPREAAKPTKPAPPAEPAKLPERAEPALTISPSTLQASKERATAVLIEATMSPSAGLRSNAIEAMASLPDRALPVTHRGLSDANPAVRFAAVVTAGRLGFKELIPAIRPLLKDENTSVRAAGIFSLHTLGEEINLTPLADMLASRDPGLRSNVALLLGLLGDESAIPMLRHSAGIAMPRASAAQEASTRIQVAEAIARLGDDSSLDALRAGIYSQFHEVRVLAITTIGAVGDRRMEVALEQILRDADIQLPKDVSLEDRRLADRVAAELQLASAGALARMGNFNGRATVLARLTDADPVVRYQAAWALGWFADRESQMALAVMLSDAVPEVRVAAAAGVVRPASTGGGAGK